MAQIIAIHAFRRGTGKSALAANLAVIWAAEGRRVGLVDLSRQFPSLASLFDLKQNRPPYSFSHYLADKCTIEEATENLTGQFGPQIKGQLFVASSWAPSSPTGPSWPPSSPTGPSWPPSSPTGPSWPPSSPTGPNRADPADLGTLASRQYDLGKLAHGFYELVESFALDILILDTQAGLNEESFISITLSDLLAVVLRPDQQHYQGTAVMMQLARHLKVPRSVLVINAVPAVFDFVQIQEQLENNYQSEVAAVLPYDQEMMTVAGGEIFALRYADHPLTVALKQLAAKLAV